MMSAVQIQELSDATGIKMYPYLRKLIAEEAALIVLHDAKRAELSQADVAVKEAMAEQPRAIVAQARSVATTGEGEVRLQVDAVAVAREQLELRRKERQWIESAKVAVRAELVPFPGIGGWEGALLPPHVPRHRLEKVGGLLQILPV